MKYLILGAGPTGLGAAMHLLERNQTDFLLVDAAPIAGGLSSSFVDDAGFTWDLGGHVQFSHYEIFDRYMDLALGADGWLQHQRESWVWIKDRFVPYPFQYNLHRLPPNERWACMKGLFEVSNAEHLAPKNFHEWISRTFGNGIADLFMLPYNFKVWAYPPSIMNSQWVGERVAVPNIERVVEGICLQEDQVSWGPNSTFRFPRKGGTGAIWRALSDRIPQNNKSLGINISKIDPSQKTAYASDGSSYEYDFLVSTIPVDKLTHICMMDELSAVSSQLRHSSTHVVGIGLEGTPPPDLQSKCWMYFPEDNSPFYRVTVFSNYSPENTPRPGETWSLMAEVSESSYKPVDATSMVSDVIQGMRNTKLISSKDEIVSRWYQPLSYGYPTPTVGRDEHIDCVLPALEKYGIFSRGRFGAWKYEVSNQDHSFMQGWECIGRLEDGRGSEAEPTLNTPHVVNAGYNRV